MYPAIIFINKIDEVNKIFWHIAKLYKDYFSVIGYDKTIQKEVKLHRYLTKCPKNLIVDHINRNPLDNRLSNLRITNHSNNMLNRNIPPNNKLQVKGVHLHYRKYQARIMVNKKAISLGHFNTIEEAIKAREDFCKLHDIIS